MKPKPRKARRTAEKPVGRSAQHEGKTRKEFWLDPRVLSEAQEFLGAATERETVEIALDLVTFRKELGVGTQALRGMRLERLD